MKNFLDPITENMTLRDLINANSEKYPEKVILQIWENERLSKKITFAELFQETQNLAKKLQNLGVKPGYRVVIIDLNSIEWIIHFFALMYIGATAVLIDPRMDASGYRSLIKQADPQLILINDNFVEKLPPECLDQVPARDIHQLDRSFSSQNAIPECLDGDPSIAVMMFTSGTTGDLKAACLDHQALLYAADGSIEMIGVGSEDEILMILPLTHIFGLVAGLLIPLALGARVTFIDKLTGETILKAMQETKTTVMPCVPRIAELFATKIQATVAKKSSIVRMIFSGLHRLCYFFYNHFGWNLGRYVFAPVHKIFGGGLQRMISGGAPLEKGIKKYLDGLGLIVLEGYGLTETAGTSFISTIHDRQAGIVGRPIRWIKVKIDAKDKSGVGEICLSGSSIMRGYFRNPEATNNAIKDGWFHTGDLGYLTPEGYLVINGRIKELIVTASGYKAMASDVENRYLNITGIKELAVCGIPIDEKSLIEEIHAAAIVDEEFKKQFSSENLLLEELNSRIMERSGHIPVHLQIHRVHVVHSIPKTLTLKVKRAALRQMLWEKMEKNQQDAPEATIEETLDSLGQSVVATIDQVIKSAGHKLKAPILLKSSFQNDLGFDSILSLELIFAIEEKFHIHLPSELTVRLHTVGQLIDGVREQQRTEIKSEVKTDRLKKAFMNVDFSKEKELAEQYCRSSLGSQLIRGLSEILMKIFFKVYFNFKKVGKEKVPKSQRFILVSNHCSHMDIYSLLFASGLKSDDFAIAAAKDYFFKEGKKTFLQTFFHLFPFSRSADIKSIINNIKLCKCCMDLGKNLIIFPEGTRSIDGKMRPFKSLFGLLTAELDVPILPAYIKGAFEAFPKGTSFPKPHPVTVIFGDPIPPSYFKEKYGNLKGSQYYAKIVEEINGIVSDLKLKLERGPNE